MSIDFQGDITVAMLIFKLLLFPVVGENVATHC